MNAATDNANITDAGKAAVEAIANGQNGFVFDGNYSNADRRAIADAWKARLGVSVSSEWFASL